MAITHLYWRAPYLDLHCPTEAGPLMCVSHAASKKNGPSCFSEDVR
jgi:hypothetical protein